MNKEKQEIQKELNELIAAYYDGSFPQMACDYIHATGMTEEEVEALLEAMKNMTKRNESLLFCPKYRKCAETIAERL